MQSQVAALLDGPAPNGPLIRVGHALFCLQHELLGLLDRVVEMLLHLLRVVQQQRRNDQIVLHQVEAAHRHRVVARDGRVELFENGHDLRLVLFDEIIGDHFGYFSAMRHIETDGALHGDERRHDVWRPGPLSKAAGGNARARRERSARGGP